MGRLDPTPSRAAGRPAVRESICSMTRILIPTYPEDLHAEEVALALDDRGHEAVLWCGSDFPTPRQPRSTSRWPGELGDLRAGAEQGDAAAFDVVWYAASAPPVLPRAPPRRPARRAARMPASPPRALPSGRAGAPSGSTPSRAAPAPTSRRCSSRRHARRPRRAAHADQQRSRRIRRFLEELRGRTVYKPFHARSGRATT